MSCMGALMYQVDRGAGTRRGAGRHTEKRVPCARGHTLGDSVAREAAGEDDAAPRHLELPGPARIRPAAPPLAARPAHQPPEAGLRERTAVAPAPWHRTFTAPETRKLTRSCASSAAKICWPARQCVICERATIASMADTVRPSRVAFWLRSARSVDFAGVTAVTMPGAIAMRTLLI